MATTNPFGTVIDLSTESIQKGARGAVKTFEADLVALLKGVTAVLAVAVSFYVVDRANYPANDAGETAFKNERQRVSAVLRSHAREAGLGKVGIDWHPVGNFPQVSLKAT
ncbi:MAG: hypothetical protein ABGY29_05445 [bacterium]|jgi:hypothetical protein